MEILPNGCLIRTAWIWTLPWLSVFSLRSPRRFFQVAAAYLENRIVAGVAVHISDLVLAEAYFALQTFYHYSKADALSALAALSQTDGLCFSPGSLAVLSLPNLATAKPGFVDRLIHAQSLTVTRVLVTFEKASKKLPGTIVL